MVLRVLNAFGESAKVYGFLKITSQAKITLNPIKRTFCSLLNLANERYFGREL